MFRYVQTFLGLGLILAQFLFAGGAAADHPTVGFGSGLSGPINTIPAMVLPKNMRAAGVRTEFVHFNTFGESALNGFAASGNDVHDSQDLLGVFAGMAYGVTDSFTISARVPYVIRRQLREAHLEDGVPEVHHQGDSSGVGDLTLFGQYRFVKTREWQATFLGGLKTPMGNTHVRDRAGNRFEADHQPGSGSWDPMVGLALTRAFDRSSIHANILNSFATEGSQNTELGDVLNYNIAFVYRLNPHEDHSHSEEAHAPHTHVYWDGILELNGERRGWDQTNGITDANSGGVLVYLSPGVRMTLSGIFSAFVSVGVPVVESLNGIQNDPQLRTLFGVGFGF